MKPLHFRKAPRGAPVNTDGRTAILPAAYYLAKVKTAAAVIEYMNYELPERFFPALKDHVASRPAVFAPIVLQTVLQFIDATPADREALQLFSKPPPIEHFQRPVSHL